MTFSTILLAAFLASLMSAIVRKGLDAFWSWLSAHIVWNPPPKKV